MPKYELNLRDYWIIIQKRIWVIVSIVVVVFITTVIYTNRLPYVYEASATIRFKEERTVGSAFSEFLTGALSDPLASYAKVIISQPFLEKVALELGLAGEHASQSEIANQARSLQGVVSTKVVEGTNIISINARHGDPNMTAKIANKVAEVFIIENFREKNKQARQVREFIDKQLSEITTKLDDSEIKLKEFRERELPTGVAIPLQNRLADLEMKKRDLLRQYTELHPDIVMMNEELENLKEQIKNLPEKELGFSRLTRDVDLNTRLYTDLKTRLEGARISEAEHVEGVALLDPATVPGAPIAPDKKTNILIGLALGLLVGFVAAFIVEELDTSIGTIEGVEAFLKLPVLGVIPYIKTQGEKVTIFSKIFPKRYKGEKKISRLTSQLLLYYPPRSAIVEAYKLLRTNIQMEVLKSPPKGKIILLSSASPEEGKTLTVSNLAITFAQSGVRTLLVDGDLRRASIHKIFGTGDKSPGIADILRGTVNLEDSIKTFADVVMGDLEVDKLLSMPGIDNLNLLTCGGSPTAPAEILGTPELKNMFLKFRENYDIILVDSPPILAVADAMILAPLADAVILVYKVGKTASAALMRAKVQLEAVNIFCKGIILNNISPDVEMRTSYYYHYKYYGEKKSGKEKEAA